MSIREEITRQLIETIEAGAPPWRQGWSVPLLHRNAQTGKSYSGINNLLLTSALTKSGNCAIDEWMTFKQAKAAGHSIKKGAKASHIVRMVEVDRFEKISDGDEVLAEERGKKLVMKTYAVFNGQDIEGWQPAERLRPDIQPSEAVEAIVAGLKANGMIVLHGGSAASYSPRIDTLRIPERAAFEDALSLYATMLHECGHATGHSSRLARFGKTLGLDSLAERAKEEIRVEMAASFLCAELFPPSGADNHGPSMGQKEIANHAAYLESWLQALKSSTTHNEVFRAAADAQKIADYLKGMALKPQATLDGEHKCSEIPVQVVQVAQEARPARKMGMRP